MTSSTEAMDPFIIEDDLMNIEYGDLLSMVKNLTQSRAAIKSKQKEITRLQSLLKEKATETSELTSKCAELDALKAQNEDLSIKNDSLNSEINRLKSETKDLVHVNKELESALHNQSKNEATHAVNICQIHNEFRMLFEKYVALEQLTHQFDTTIAQEKADKTVLQSRIIVLESKLNDLIKENFNLVDQLNIANRRIVACDGDLAHASNQLYDLSLELSNLDKAQRENEERKWSSSWEVELLNADISRLLHLIAHFPTAAPFLLEWQSAHRLAYIGDYDSHTVEEGVLDPHDSSYPHSRRYNEEAHATYWHDAGFRSSAELSHLCRVYGSSKGTNEENRTIEVSIYIYT